MSLQVPTYVAASKIHGNGLFARFPIRKGTIVWQFTQDDVVTSTPPPFELQHLFHKLPDERWILWGDDARFVNHSDTPNIGGTNGDIWSDSVALRDISADEELVEDYGGFGGTIPQTVPPD